MTYPPLPPPSIIDGRRLYTAGDMRAYGDVCVDACREADSEYSKPPTTQRDTPRYGAAVDELFSTLGIKK